MFEKMESISRLSPQDRRRHATLFVRASTRVDPKVKPVIKKVVRATIEKRAHVKHIVAVLKATMDSDTLKKTLYVAHSMMIGLLLQERELTIDKPCHGCLGYAPQLTCPKCSTMCFCAGCWDYGMCMVCEE